MDFSQYLDSLKERLIIFAELVKERAAPLMEILERTPYYPYSVIGIAAVILLLLALLIARKRSAALKAKQAKDSGADRARPRVSGVAVGLSSHEEFNYGNAQDSPDSIAGSAAQADIPVSTPQIVEAPVFTAAVPPVAAAASTPLFTPIPVNAAPAVTVPIITVPTVTVEAQTPASMTPSADDSELEATIKLCQEKFQAIYMEIYIQFGLLFDFDRFRTEVVNRINDAKITHRAIAELKMTPEGLILAHMASVAGGFLQSGQYHTGKGQMDIGGQELLMVYRYALNTMREKGLASPTDVQNKLDFMEKKVLEIGD